MTNSQDEISQIDHSKVEKPLLCIFKNANTEEYMVCILGQGLNNSHSDVLPTINDCYDWIDVN